MLKDIEMPRYLENDVSLNPEGRLILLDIVALISYIFLAINRLIYVVLNFLYMSCGSYESQGSCSYIRIEV